MTPEWLEKLSKNRDPAVAGITVAALIAIGSLAKSNIPAFLFGSSFLFFFVGIRLGRKPLGEGYVSTPTTLSKLCFAFSLALFLIAVWKLV